MNGNLDHKTKMISLRLSAVEFDFLRNRYQSYGARNVSDLARLAVQRMMNGSDNPDNSTAAKVAVVEQSVTDLNSRMATLESQVATILWEREMVTS